MYLGCFVNMSSFPSHSLPSFKPTPAIQMKCLLYSVVFTKRHGFHNPLDILQTVTALPLGSKFLFPSRSTDCGSSETPRLPGWMPTNRAFGSFPGGFMISLGRQRWLTGMLVANVIYDKKRHIIRFIFMLGLV